MSLNNKKIFLGVFIIILIITSFCLSKNCYIFKKEQLKKIEFSMEGKENIDCNLEYKIEKDLLKFDINTNINFDKIYLKAIAIDINGGKSTKIRELLNRDNANFRLFTDTEEDIKLAKIEITITKDNQTYTKTLEI